MRFLQRKCSYFKKLKQTIIHSHWCEYLPVMCTFLVRSGHKLQNLVYGIEVLHIYENECNTDRGVVIKYNTCLSCVHFLCDQAISYRICSMELKFCTTMAMNAIQTGA